MQDRSPARWALVTALALAAFISMSWSAGGRAADGPQPPCAAADGGSFPPTPEPAVRVWFANEIEGGAWQPPHCLDWPVGPFSVIVETRGTIDHADGADSLLARLATVSDLTRVRYWSIRAQRWRPLIHNAHATTGPDRRAGRRDFDLRELAEGAEVHLWQDENSPAGSMVYRVRVSERSEGRLRLDVRSTQPLTLFLVPVVAAGDHRFVYVIERQDAGRWRYYSLMLTGAALIPLPAEHRGSFVNRAVAMYRYFAGLPTDQEPPAVRDEAP
ncbi:MAG: hypothetical protein EXQ85_09215 [Alphaproteobacteria bacterium]|nr:hypothetical protein [Alphaproteobacteria bacterium]